jgi:hypothetical protein
MCKKREKDEGKKGKCKVKTGKIDGEEGEYGTKRLCSEQKIDFACDADNISFWGGIR